MVENIVKPLGHYAQAAQSKIYVHIREKADEVIRTVTSLLDDSLSDEQKDRMKVVRASARILQVKISSQAGIDRIFRYCQA